MSAPRGKHLATVTAVSLPGIDAAVNEVRNQLATEGARVALVGSWGSGKSTALAKLGQELASTQGRRVVRLSLPLGDDAAVVALCTAAAQLGAATLAEVKRPNLSWGKKLDRVAEEIESEPTVVLFDEPRLREPSLEDSTLFHRRAFELSQRFWEARASRVFAVGFRPQSPGVSVVQVAPRSVPEEILAPGNWNGLGPTAKRLLDVGGTQLESYSPMELRLAVGLCARGIDPEKILDQGWRQKELVNRLVGTFTQAALLKKVLGRLALLRLPIDDELLKWAGATGVPSDDRKLLHSILLFGEPNRWKLHELIAFEARESWLARDENLDAHKSLSDLYRRRFGTSVTSADVGDALRLELEVTHHRTEAGDATLIQEQLFFVEQYDALGKTLSIAERYGEAVRAYERSVQLDPDDWYAHHYLAFNLDFQGCDPARVENEYRQAIVGWPEQVWFHGRYICFLLTCGRLHEAGSAWSEAIRVFAQGGNAERFVYDELHRPIARLALELGQVQFAERVLADVPGHAQEQHRWYRSFRQFLTTQKEAASDELVFPLHIPVDQRWSGPHLLRSSDDLTRVERWLPGRIAAKDGNVTRVRIARRDANGAVSFGWRDIAAKELRALSPEAAAMTLPANTFVEFVQLRERSKVVERMLSHDLSHPEDPDLARRPLPPVDRYLLAATDTQS